LGLKRVIIWFVNSTFASKEFDLADKTTVAVLGGTGAEGSGLVFRWAHSGYDVIIGSRTQEKAERVAGELNAELGEALIRGMENPDAAHLAEIVVLTVPYSAHRATVESVKEAVQGKVFIDVTVPIAPPVATVTLPAGRTAAEEAQAILGKSVKVVSAFQSVSAVHLKDLDYEVDCDVLVTGDNAEAKAATLELVKGAGMTGYDAGPLANAIVAESLTPVLIYINKTYKVKHSGIRITGLDEA
jgi:NADPH-dependent F420 reductase